MYLQLFSSFSRSVRINRAVIEKQLAEFALIVLLLFHLHALNQLKFELGRPRTSIVMMNQLMCHQGCSWEPSSTQSAPMPEHLEEGRGMPQVTEISVQYHIQQHLKSRMVGQCTMSESQGLLIVLLWYEHLCFTGVENHGHLSNSWAYVGPAIVVDRWIAHATMAADQGLEQVPDHVIGSLPELPMRLLEMRAKIIGSHIDFTA